MAMVRSLAVRMAGKCIDSCRLPIFRCDGPARAPRINVIPLLPAFEQSANLYDAIYTVRGKDYAREADYIQHIITGKTQAGHIFINMVQGDVQRIACVSTGQELTWHP